MFGAMTYKKLLMPKVSMKMIGKLKGRGSYDMTSATDIPHSVLSILNLIINTINFK